MYPNVWRPTDSFCLACGLGAAKTDTRPSASPAGGALERVGTCCCYYTHTHTHTLARLYRLASVGYTHAPRSPTQTRTHRAVRVWRGRSCYQPLPLVVSSLCFRQVVILRVPLLSARWGTDKLSSYVDHCSIDSVV